MTFKEFVEEKKYWYDTYRKFRDAEADEYYAGYMPNDDGDGYTHYIRKKWYEIPEGRYLGAGFGRYYGDSIELIAADGAATILLESTGVIAEIRIVLKPSPWFNDAFEYCGVKSVEFVCSRRYRNTRQSILNDNSFNWIFDRIK